MMLLSSLMCRCPCRICNGIVALIAMALLPSMHRRLCRCCNCNCHPHDNGVIAVFDVQASLLSSRLNCCPCNNGGVALDLQQHCYPCRNGIICILKLASLPLSQMTLSLSSMHRHPYRHCDGVVALIAMVLLSLMPRHLCRCHNCDCCHHDDARAPLPLSRWCCCPRINGVVALDLRWHCCPHCNSIVAILKLALLPS
jgi:hypothetical protein